MDDLWRTKMVAFAYQYQREARPYKNLIEDFAPFLFLKGGETVLDLGCGSGRLMQLILERSKGSVNTIVGLDSTKQALKYAQRNLRKNFLISQINLIQADISSGLPFFMKNHFHLITAGLSIQYAQHWDGKKWTKEAYKKAIANVFELLKPRGRFVFSVNVPNPDFSRIAKESKREIFLSLRFPLNILVSIIMLWQAKWLVKQAKVGRFHYLPIEEVIKILEESNFTNISYKLTYADLAWVISCQKL